MDALTRGDNFDANINWSGPVKMAVGIICIGRRGDEYDITFNNNKHFQSLILTSPNTSSNVTLKMIVIHVGNSLSKNRGRHSYANEFITNKVTINRWF
jgi:hypothetical protein